MIRRIGSFNGNYYDEFYNPADGKLAKRSAIIDGFITDEWYNDGALVYRIGKGGIYYVSSIPESYTLRRLRNLNNNNAVTDFTEFHNTIRANMYQKTSQPERFEFRGNKDAYEYNAGVNEFSESNKEYEGLKNTQSKTDNIADGWYAYEQLGWMMVDGLDQTLVIVHLIRVISGKIATSATTNVPTNGYVFNQF